MPIGSVGNRVGRYRAGAVALVAMLGGLAVSPDADARQETGERRNCWSFTEEGKSLDFCVTGADMWETAPGRYTGRITGDEVSVSGTATISVQSGYGTEVVLTIRLTSSDGAMVKDGWPPEGTSNHLSGPVSWSQSFSVSVPVKPKVTEWVTITVIHRNCGVWICGDMGGTGALVGWKPLCDQAWDFFGEHAAVYPRYGLRYDYAALEDEFAGAISTWESPDRRAFMSPGGEPVMAGLWLFSEGDPFRKIPGLAEPYLNPSLRFSFSPDPTTDQGQRFLDQVSDLATQGRLVEGPWGFLRGTEAGLANAIALKSREQARGLTPGEVLGLALDSTGGDLRRAALLAHNTLKSLGREGMMPVTGLRPDASFFEDHLVPIRDTDSAGAWYHLFGTFYYQLEVQDGVSVPSMALSAVGMVGAGLAYVPAQPAVQGYQHGQAAAAWLAGADAEEVREIQARAASSDRLLQTLEAIVNGTLPTTETGWTDFANTAEQAFRELLGGRVPDPEKYCVNYWGSRLAQQMWRRLRPEVPQIVIREGMVNDPFARVAGGTVDLSDLSTAEPTVVVEKPEGTAAPWGTVPPEWLAPSDPPLAGSTPDIGGVGYPQLAITGSPVDILLEVEGRRLYFDQEAALILTDGEFPYPVFPYMAGDGRLALGWVMPAGGPEPEASFIAVGDGNLHLAVINPQLGELVVWTTPVQAGEQFHWSPPVPGSEERDPVPAMLTADDGRVIEPVVTAFSFDASGNLVVASGSPVGVILIVVGLIVAGMFGLLLLWRRRPHPAMAAAAEQDRPPPPPPPPPPAGSASPNG